MVRGSAANDGEYIYFTIRGSMKSYNYYPKKDKWKCLPPYKFRDAGLVIINSELTTVGGYDGSHYTNKLLTLQGKKWHEQYPAMKAACSSSAVVSTPDGNYLLVIGGMHGGDWTAKVQLFQVRTKKWCEETNLPQCITRPSATICNNEVYVIGTDDGRGYSCSLQALQSSGGRVITSESKPHLSWKNLPPLPVRKTTVTTLCGQVIVVGGRQGALAVKSIHQLWEGKWVNIGSIKTYREMCFAVSLLDRVLIVGGQGKGNEELVVERISVQNIEVSNHSFTFYRS